VTEEFARAVDKALRLLAFRARSRRELTDRLVRAGFSDECAEETARAMEERHYIDDYRFASDFIEDKTRLRYWGRLRIISELTRLGVERGVTEKALCDSEVDWTRTALAALESAPKERRKAAAALARKGFTEEEIRTVIKDAELD
jgi:regulatory protein